MLLLVLLTAVLALVVIAAATTFAVVRTLELYRQFRAFGGALDDELARLSTGSARLESQAASVSAGDVGPALERLAVSRAKLSVLLTAAADVRAAVTRVTALRPQK